MKKEDFLKLMQGEDEAVILKLYNKLTIAEKSGKSIYTNEFYTPGIWGRLMKFTWNPQVKISSYGAFDEAERRIICFNSEDYAIMPVKVILLLNKSKFHNLQHKDYLGAIMSLGIKREKIGDLIVQGSTCYCAVCEDIVDYLKMNLNYIAQCPCEVTEITDYSKLPEYNFQENQIISTSLRADCIVSSICGLSRSKSVDLLKSGKVLIDYIEVREKDFEITLPTTITIRGKGKFKLLDVLGNSSSGRLKIQLKKFD